MNIYDFELPATDGSSIPMKDYEGKVLLIVNTATGCGFTPHYEALQKCTKPIMIKVWKSSIFLVTNLLVRLRAPMRKFTNFVLSITTLNSLR